MVGERQQCHGCHLNDPRLAAVDVESAYGGDGVSWSVTRPRHQRADRQRQVPVYSPQAAGVNGGGGGGGDDGCGGGGGGVWLWNSCGAPVTFLRN